MRFDKDWPTVNPRIDKVLQNREKRSDKILQFGGGNFLRGYFDWMIQVLNEQTDFNGNIVVVKPTKRGDYEDLRSQHGLYHTTINGIKDGVLISERQLIDCISKVVHPYLAWEDFLLTAEISSIQYIVSNTTESGIKFSSADLISQNPPHEFPAKVTRWLHHRFMFFEGAKDKGCIFLPCELIEDNGLVLQECILQYIASWNLGSDFQNWVKSNNVFCNTLVDRIVPGFPEDRRGEIYEDFGIVDQLEVSVEPYHIFVIQSPIDLNVKLPFGETDLNVVFTDDMTKYRQLKVRILNGLHTSMVPVGYLMGINTVRETIDDTVIGNFLDELLYEEILPSLDYPKDFLKSYANDILDRFRNPYIHHRLISIALNSISKFRTRVLPSLLSYHKVKKKLPNRIVFVLASYIWFYRGKTESDIIPLNDSQEVIDLFSNLWRAYHTQDIQLNQLVETVLSDEQLWEFDLMTIKGLPMLIQKYLQSFIDNDYRVPEF